MNVKTVAISALFLASVSLFAQENESKNESNEAIKYSNITEFGFLTTNPSGIAFEAVTIHGFSIDKKHCLGIGIGMGLSSHLYSSPFYTPVFVNYRYYFSPHKTFSPHVNVAVGGVGVEDGFGIYSVITAGFRAGKFSFSSGVSFMPVYEQHYYDNYYYGYYGGYHESRKEWIYPFGIVLKVGFSF